MAVPCTTLKIHVMDVLVFKVRKTITVPKIYRRCLPCELEAKTEPFIVVVFYDDRL